MLEADLSGRPYVELRHSQALMGKIGRTHRSIEFKHQNISAVLDELAMPWWAFASRSARRPSGVLSSVGRAGTRLVRFADPFSNRPRLRRVAVSLGLRKAFLSGSTIPNASFDRLEPIVPSNATSSHISPLLIGPWRHRREGPKRSLTQNSSNAHSCAVIRCKRAGGFWGDPGVQRRGNSSKDG